MLTTLTYSFKKLLTFYVCLSLRLEARADMARVLALGVNSCKVLILDEFTSLVDRATAMKMAKGLQQLINQRTPPRPRPAHLHVYNLQQ